MFPDHSELIKLGYVSLYDQVIINKYISWNTPIYIFQDLIHIHDCWMQMTVLYIDVIYIINCDIRDVVVMGIGVKRNRIYRRNR